MSWIRKGDPPRHPKLTATQEAALPEICEKWNKIVLNTAPADRARAERGVAQLYEAGGLNPPTEMVWHTSLEKAMEERPLARRYHVYNDFKWTNLIDIGVLPYPGWVNRWYVPGVFTSTRDTVFSSVSNFWFPERLLEGANVGIPSGQVPPDSEGTFYSIGYGLDRAQECALVDFFSNVVGIEYQQPYLLDAIASCGFMWLGKDKVVFVERPSIVRLDNLRRPHCVDGPAIQYRDGLTVYVIHGVPVPRKYIETSTEQIDLAEVLQEENAEVRMAVISKVGFKRLLETVEPNNELQQTCPDCGKCFTVVIPGRILQKKQFSKNIARVLSRANGNSLIELSIGRRPREESSRGPGPERIRLLHVTWQDKTGSKETAIPVPRTMRQFGRDCPDDINDCEQVRRWTLGWPKDVEILAET